MKNYGDIAEDYTAEQLKARGWKILARNWKTPFAEIDIISQDTNGVLHSVEVKYRSRSHADGYSSITHAKLEKLRKGTLTWCQQNNYEGPIQIDAAIVRPSHDQSLELDLVENISFDF